MKELTKESHEVPVERHDTGRQHHSNNDHMNDLLEEPLEIKEDGADHITHDEHDVVHDSRFVEGDEPLVTVTPSWHEPEPEQSLESPHPHKLYYPEPVVVDHIMPLAHHPRPVHEP